MAKRVSFNEIEILTSEGDTSARSLFGMVESFINHLISDLGPADENFHAFIDMEVTPNRPARHSVSIKNLSNNGTRGKVMKILEKSTSPHRSDISGKVRIDLQVDDM